MQAHLAAPLWHGLRGIVVGPGYLGCGAAVRSLASKGKPEDKKQKKAVVPKTPPAPEYEGESEALREFRLHNSSIWGIQGQVVSGEVIVVGRDYVIMDLGFGSLSRFFKRELSTTQIYDVGEGHKLKRKEGVFFRGDQLRFRVDTIETPYGDLGLTAQKLETSIRRELVWKELLQAHKKNSIVSGRVLNPVERGYAIGIGGLVCFCPLVAISPYSAQKIGSLQPFKIHKMEDGSSRSVMVMSAADDIRRPGFSARSNRMWRR